VLQCQKLKKQLQTLRLLIQIILSPCIARDGKQFQHLPRRCPSSLSLIQLEPSTFSQLKQAKAGRWGFIYLNASNLLLRLRFQFFKNGVRLMEIQVMKRMKWCLIFFLFIFVSRGSFASDLMLLPTPSTGYQPQFQVSGNKIYYVWHEDPGPTEPIWIAIETLKEK